MRRYLAFVVAAFALITLGAKPWKHAAVLPPSVQPSFERVMLAVNQKHALGRDARITDISIDKQQVRIKLELEGRKLGLALMHPNAKKSSVESNYFRFDYDERAWSGHRAQLAKLAVLIDQQFPRTPWFIPRTHGEVSSKAWMSWPVVLSRRLAMTLFGSSWLLGLSGTVLLLRRRPQR